MVEEAVKTLHKLAQYDAGLAAVVAAGGTAILEGALRGGGLPPAVEALAKEIVLDIRRNDGTDRYNAMRVA